MSLRSIAAKVIPFGMALALGSCSAAPAPVSLDYPEGAPVAGQAVSILNAGVMTAIGSPDSGQVKFLFDPLYDDHFGSLEQLTPELIGALVTGAAPYDNVDAVFVSHAHGDHFSANMLTRMLAAQPQLRLVAPGQAIERLREHEGWQEIFELRVRAITLANGQSSEGFELSGATIEAFRTPHNGWPESHSNVHNITFRVSAPVADGQVGRVMHLGDADPSSEHYSDLQAFLQEKRSGLAMVPFWFYREGDLTGLIDGTLNAEMPVAMHVPVRVPVDLRDGELTYFSSVGEVLEFPATD